MDKSKHFKLLIVLLFAMMANTTNLKGQAIPYNDPCNANWRLSFYDNFDSFDNNKWSRFNNNDKRGDLGSVNIESNVSVVNGKLKLDIIKEDYTCPLNNDGSQHWYCFRQRLAVVAGNTDFHYRYTSGYIKSNSQFKFKYGYIEARISYPIEPGTWSSFWTYRSDPMPPSINHSEIDITEVQGIEQSTSPTSGTNIHLSYTPPINYPADHTVSSPISNYHIYSVNWTPSTIQFYIDGVLVRTLNNPGVNDYVNMLFDAWVKLNYDTDNAKYNAFTNNTLSMYVDWVRVYKPYTYTGLTLLEKTPYIINPKDDLNNNGRKEVTVMWQLPTGTTSSTVCTINWGQSISYGNSTTINDNATVDHLYSKTLDDLHPNTKYYYQIIGGGQNYSGLFVTPSTNSSSNVVFYASGNRIDAKNNQTLAENNDIAGVILNNIQNHPSSQTFLIKTNGFVSGDNKELWRDEFFTYSNNRNILKAQLPIVGGISDNERKIMCLDAYSDPVITRSTSNAMNFHTYLPFNYVYPYLNNSNDFNYDLSMNYGPVHICFPEITDQAFSSTDLSVGFIDSDLGATTKEWKVLSINFPLKSLNGNIINSAAYNTIRQKAINNGVQLVLMGHEDYYAHWVDNGIHFLVLGNGGSTTNGIDDQKIQNDNQLVFASTVPHFAKFNIDGNMMYVDIIQGADYNGYSKGRVIEKFAIPKDCYITDNQIWNSGAYPIITDYIWVANGGKLKIESEVQLLKDKSIKISKGAYLNITGNSAVITSTVAFTENLDLVTKNSSGVVTNTYKANINHATSFWNGIELNSYPSLSQTSANQGVLSITNGATIKNAKVGVAIKQLTSTGWRGGGILRADEAVFENNICDIKMYPYQGIRILGSKEIKLHDKTRITRSYFLTDNNFIDNSKSIKHIVLNGVKGVLLYGNEFDNTNTTLLTSQKGIGVLSIESTFNLNNSSYYFLNTSKANTFNNLRYGIKTYNSVGKGSSFIKGCTFSNTYSSIYLDNSFYTYVLGNNITVPELDNVVVNNLPYGIYVDGGMGFKVEDNQLDISGSMAGTIGIIVNGTGANENQIYRNTLTGFNVAIQPQNENFGFNSEGNNIGLHLFCNTFSGFYDAWVGKSSGYNGAVGIAADQQMSDIVANHQTTLPAGNQFSTANRFANCNYDFDNAVGNNIYYYYEQNASYNAEPIYIKNVIAQSITNTNTCPSKSNSGSTSISLLISNLSLAQLSLNSSKVILSIWQDGGNANLDEVIETTQPWDVYIEFNNLIAESPYLSDDVLMATINNSAFTSLMIKLIMVANPQASRNEEIMNMIKERMPSMPQNYIDAIKAGEEVKSQIDLLRNNVSSDYHLVGMIGDDIKCNYSSDTISGYGESNMLSFVAAQTDLLDKYELASRYLANGDYEQMNNTLSSINENFELNEQQISNQDDFVSTFNLAQSMYSSNSYFDVLNEEQRISLNTVLSYKGSQVSQMALALLMRNNPDFEYSELILQPTESSARMASNEDKVIEDKTTYFKLYPNPTTDYFTLEYQLDADKYSNLQMEIYDATGRKVITQKLDSSNEATLIDVSSLSKGVYNISFIADGIALSTHKLTIVK
ncbi:MAG: hypothetical protein DRI86_11020 [Bacteroidetes bacterium]|nr:MAG: hypothetical protein DRI86_11020 [Bacteroidota bacterium]